MSKAFLAFLLAAFLMLATSSLCDASYTFDMGTGSSVDTSGTHDVLQMEASVNLALGDIVYTLEDSYSHSFYFATFYTNETWINEDDLIPGTVVAKVDFDNPDLEQSIPGSSVGFSGLFSFTQGWNLTWKDPVAVNFGDGGRFTIELDDVSYQSWFWQGPAGYADVNATVTLISSPVPIPPSALLLGSGLIGLIGVSRRYRSK